MLAGSGPCPRCGPVELSRPSRHGQRRSRRVGDGEFQALSVTPARKYQSDGGPTPGQVAELIRATIPGTDAEADVWRFVDALAFNWLIVGTDAHAENYGLLLAGISRAAAPASRTNHLEEAEGAPRTRSSTARRRAESCLSPCRPPPQRLQPTLNAANIIELGAVWVPSFMRKLEAAMEAFGRHEQRLQKLSLRPSEYMERQVRVTPLASSNGRCAVPVMMTVAVDPHRPLEIPGCQARRCRCPNARRSAAR